MKGKVYPPLLRTQKSKDPQRIKFYCDTENASWYYSIEKMLGSHQVAIDGKSLGGSDLDYNMVASWKQGFYYCFGVDKVTNQPFLDKGELRIYGTFSYH